MPMVTKYLYVYRWLQMYHFHPYFQRKISFSLAIWRALLCSTVQWITIKRWSTKTYLLLMLLWTMLFPSECLTFMYLWYKDVLQGWILGKNTPSRQSCIFSLLFIKRSDIVLLGLAVVIQKPHVYIRNTQYNLHHLCTSGLKLWIDLNLPAT